jgi:hypothetical protein
VMMSRYSKTAWADAAGLRHPRACWARSGMHAGLLQDWRSAAQRPRAPTTANTHPAWVCAAAHPRPGYSAKAITQGSYSTVMPTARMVNHHQIRYLQQHKEHMPGCVGLSNYVQATPCQMDIKTDMHTTVRTSSPAGGSRSEAARLAV